MMGFVGHVPRRKYMEKKKLLITFVITAGLVLGIAVPAIAKTEATLRTDMAKAHQLADLGRYFGYSNLIELGQQLYAAGVAELPKAIKEASRSGGREYLGEFTLTAYCNGCAGTITASGARTTLGKTVAVDPLLIPLGTQIYIEGLGYRTAQDTGGAIKGKKIDIFIATENGHCACSKNFGQKSARVWRVK